MAHILKRTLMIALPLPERLGGPKRTVREDTSTPLQPPTSSSSILFTYDHAFWLSVRKIPFISLRPVLRTLGLKWGLHHENSDRGPINFVGGTVTELSDAVNELAESLPQVLEALVATALDEAALDAEIEGLLALFGMEIWGAGDERSWLLNVTDGVEEYQKDLVLEDANDRAVIKKHLRNWTLIKGFNNCRKMSVQTKGPGRKRKPGARGSFLTSGVTGGADRELQTAASSGQLVAPSTTSSLFVPDISKQASDTLPPTPCWTAAAWRRFAKTSVIPISTMTSCLGLISREKDSVITYDHPIAATLSKEISRLAMRLYTQLSTEDIVRCAAKKNYLNKEIGVLLGSYASLIWGQDADLSGLLESGVKDPYPKALVYEDDADRKVLELYLHQWIFTKAFEFLREWGSSEEVKQAVRRALSKDAQTYVVPEREYALKSADIKDAQDHGKKRKAAPSPTQRPVKGTFSIPPPVRKHKVSKQQHERNPMSHSVPSTSSLQLTTLFLEYLRNHGNAGFKEQSHLNAIKADLADLTPSLINLFIDKQLISAFPTVLTAWISFRRTISTVAQQLAALSTQNLSAMDEKILRARLATELRKARDAFVATGDEEMSAEDVLSFGFEGLEEITWVGARMRHEVREGLRSLDRELVELGERTGAGNGEWIVMG